ncbi:MAG: hypothetical protein KDD32_12865 [Bacteroidetes bacterium]|nr:hypothetical protein [Bacteroidota bacterium]
MGFRFFLKTRQPKAFNYQPLYYDERKEKLKELEERVKAENEGKIPTRYQLKFDKKHGLAKSNQYSNLRIVAIAIILSVMVYLLLR